MKNEKKTLGKKRKKDNNDENEDNKPQQKEIENQDEINNESNNNKKNNIKNNTLNIIENQNNSSVKNDTINNNILISKKNNSSSFTLFTFNKDQTNEKDNENNEIENNNQNLILNTNKNNNNNNNNVINNNSGVKNNIQQKNNSINKTAIITSKYKNTNSGYSDNSEDSHSSSPKNARGGTQSKNPKFKSHLQNSRNTAFGLKEISKRVMEIIKQSGQTTYKAISDQIVNEINEKSIKDEKNITKDEKNIRRRIYDSLNVMKSMKLFHRDKNSKTIMWNYDQEFDPLNEIENKNDKDDKNNEYKIDSNNIIELKKIAKEKKEKSNLLNRELKGLKNVLERNNREDEKVPENNKLYFPFIVIEFQTNKDPKINVALNENQTKGHFGFDEADAMYGDLDMVSKIGNHPNFSK